jgi:hypothetical protein
MAIYFNLILSKFAMDKISFLGAGWEKGVQPAVPSQNNHLIRQAVRNKIGEGNLPWR